MTPSKRIASGSLLSSRFLPAAILLAAAGCAGLPTKSPRLSEAPQLAWPPAQGQGYIAMNVQIEDAGRIDGNAKSAVCTYRFVGVTPDGRDSGRQFNLEARAGKWIEVFPVDAGLYEVRGFYCGSGQRSLETFRRSTAEVREGRISYVGAWMIGGGTVGGAENVEADARLADWARTTVPAAARSRVISAYSGKEIPETVLLKPRHAARTSLKFKGGTSEADIVAFEKALADCAARENELYRYGLGRIRFEAQARKPARVETSGSWSDAYKSCLSDALARSVVKLKTIQGTIE